VRAWLWLALAGSVGSLPSRAFADDSTCIAASEEALTLRQHGKLHEALKQLAACADAGCPGEVKTECSRRIDEVKAAMPTLILAAKDTSGNDLYDVKVTMDGTPLATTLDGRPLSVDPGAHVFVFRQAGQAPLEKALVLREGDHDRREQVVIGQPLPVSPQQLWSPPSLPPPAKPSRWSTQRTLAVLAGGLGVVGVGLGTSWGVFALSSQNQEKSHCSTSSCSNPNQATVDYDTAHTDATASTVAFGAGAAFLAAAAVLWLTAPSVHVTPAVGSRGGGVVLGGRF
jgi:hypothetical protein